MSDARTRDLHKVQAVTPLEIAYAIARWRELTSLADRRTLSNGDLGPLAAVSDEDPMAYGERIGLGIFTLLREI